MRHEKKEHPHTERKRGGHTKREYGGKIDKKDEHEYNAKGSPEAHEAEETKDHGFKRGGHAKRKHGGHVEGHPAHERMDKRARGGHTKSHGKAVHHGHGMKHYAKGGSPLSSAHDPSGPGAKKGGHEGESLADEP